jgi:hypothetical protein
MEKQSYKNHVKYYTAHHFVFYPIILFALIVCGWQAMTTKSAEWHMMLLAIILIGWSAFMMRQHYALIEQNRIVRLELRLRYYILTGKRFEIIEEALSFKQVAALRFAADEELIPLIEKTLQENLTPDAIKRSIVNWLPDTMRV